MSHVNSKLNETDETNNIEKEENNETENKIKQNIPEKYKGYIVSAKIEIPKIKLETFVLDSKEEDAMWICPTKYYGPHANEIGNYCIAAHNYDKENMFNHIIELEIGDEIFLSDNRNGKCKYKVYDIYKVKPTDTIVLSQSTNGNIDITLITCSDYSSKRIIVKARKV